MNYKKVFDMCYKINKCDRENNVSISMFNHNRYYSDYKIKINESLNDDNILKILYSIMKNVIKNKGIVLNYSLEDDEKNILIRVLNDGVNVKKVGVII